jgi:hypothetical protein
MAKEQNVVIESASCATCGGSCSLQAFGHALMEAQELGRPDVTSAILVLDKADLEHSAFGGNGDQRRTLRSLEHYAGLLRNALWAEPGDDRSGRIEDGIAVEYRIREALHKAGIRLDLIHAGALLSIAIDHYAEHPQEGFLALMAELQSASLLGLEAGALCRVCRAELGAGGVCRWCAP